MLCLMQVKDRNSLLEADYIKFARELGELGFNGDILAFFRGEKFKDYKEELTKNHYYYSFGVDRDWYVL